MGLALSDFQKEYGTMPDVSTIAKVRASKGSKFNLGTKSSNDFFRQLIASGVVNSEMMFYAQVSDVHQPDNVFSGASALAKGECAFAYILGALKDCNPSRPIVMAPMIPGTDRFDPKPFDGKAVILKADNSVMFYPISIKTGHIMERGQNLMDPTNPIWEGKPPSIVWPEL